MLVGGKMSELGDGMEFCDSGLSLERWFEKRVVEYNEGDTGACTMSGGGGCESGDERLGCASNSTDVLGLFLQKYRRAPTMTAAVTSPATVPPTTAPTGNLNKRMDKKLCHCNDY